MEANVTLAQYNCCWGLHAYGAVANSCNKWMCQSKLLQRNVNSLSFGISKHLFV